MDKILAISVLVVFGAAALCFISDGVDYWSYETKKRCQDVTAWICVIGAVSSVIFSIVVLAR